MAYADELWTHELREEILAEPWPYGLHVPAAERFTPGPLTVIRPGTLCEFLGQEIQTGKVLFWAAPDGARQQLKCQQEDWDASATSLGN